MFSIIISEKGGAERKESFDKNEINGSSIAGSGQAIFLNGPPSFAGIWVTNNNIVNNTGRYGLFVDGNHNVGESATRAPKIDGNLFNNNLQSLNLGSRSFGTTYSTAPRGIACAAAATYSAFAGGVRPDAACVGTSMPLRATALLNNASRFREVEVVTTGRFQCTSMPQHPHPTSFHAIGGLSIQLSCGP